MRSMCKVSVLPFLLYVVKLKVLCSTYLCFVAATLGILTSQFYCALWCHRTEW